MSPEFLFGKIGGKRKEQNSRKTNEILENWLSENCNLTYFDYDCDVKQGGGKACIPNHIQDNYNNSLQPTQKLTLS